MNLEIKNLKKNYSEVNLYDDFSIGIPANTINCILGPSGCGKSTLLNIISGSESFQQGELNGFKDKTISYIFQEDRLLPWKTALQNVSFVIKDNNPKKAMEYLKMVSMEDFADYYPSKLSGGMKQRVAIARAFAFQSDIILMDEPLKALDPKLKLNIIRIFRELWEKDKRTVIFVTHDVEEALLLGENIFVFSKNPVVIKKQFKNTLSRDERHIHNASFIELEKDILNILD